MIFLRFSESLPIHKGLIAVVLFCAHSMLLIEISTFSSLCIAIIRDADTAMDMTTLDEILGSGSFNSFHWEVIPWRCPVNPLPSVSLQKRPSASNVDLRGSKQGKHTTASSLPASFFPLHHVGGQLSTPRWEAIATHLNSESFIDLDEETTKPGQI